MPRRSSSSVSSTSGTSESNIVFFAAGGHNHDGSNSSLIDASKYSIFDFDQGFLRTNTERSARQDRNRILFEDTIRSIFRTAGVELGENVISAQNIVAGSITANEIAANTITTDLLNANVITSLNFVWNGSSTYSNSGTRLSLTDGQIIGKNIRVDASGNLSVSGSGTFTGTINASGGTFTGNITAGLTQIGTNIRGSADHAGLALRSDSWDNAWVRRGDNTVYFRAGSGTRYIQIDTTTGGTNAIVFPNFSVDSGGNMSASNASISGAISGGTIDIGGSDSTSFHVNSSGDMWLGNSSYSSAPFRVSSGGALVASSATVTGTINNGGVLIAPSLSFNDGSVSGTASAIRILNNTSSASIADIANGVYFQDPSNGAIFSKIAGNTWLGSYRLDIIGPRSTYGWPRISINKDSGVFARFPNSSDQDSTLDLTEAGVFLGRDSTQNYIAIRNGFTELQSPIIRTRTYTNGGLGVIRTGSDDANQTPITIDTQHGGLSGSYYMISFYHYGANKGTILHNGTNTIYATSSDYRLKESIETINDGLEKINNLKPRYYSFIGNKEAGLQAGFIAHELQEVIPQAAFGIKDAIDEEGKPILQQIEKSAIVPHLVSAIQQLSKEIEDLKSQINKLSL